MRTCDRCQSVQKAVAVGQKEFFSNDRRRYTDEVLNLRQLGRAPEMALRFAGITEPLGEPREVDMHRPRGLEREARFEEAACLAPELGLHAKASERGEELGVPVVLGEPVLGALDAKACLLLALGERQARRQLRVERDQARAPFGGERMLDDFARESGEAKRGGVARGRRGDSRMQLVARRDGAPAALEGAGVVRRAVEELDVRLHLVFLGKRRCDGITLDELPGEAQYLVPGAGAARGA